MKAYFIIINTVIPCTNGVFYISALQKRASILVSASQVWKLENGETKSFSKGERAVGGLG